MRAPWVLVVCLVALVRTCTGSAWLQDPPSRSAAWYYQVLTPVNYDFRNLNCGNERVKIEFDGSRNCGLCGDAYSDATPRPNEWGGTYASPRVRTRYYEAGQIAEISLWNNLPGAPGFYEFRLCDEDDNQSQACLNKHLLTILETNTTNMPVPDTQGLVMAHVQLPAGVTCNYCLLQWRFRKESIEGCDDNNWCGLGRGAQIEYYNCADVTIGAIGEPKPDFIQDPTYSAADYGSAYDIGETITHPPDGSHIVGTTDAPTTTTDDLKTTTRGQIIILTNPPRTTTTTQAPATTTTQPRVITIGTTTQPPGTTSKQTITTPTVERLVINGDGSSAGTAIGGSSGNSLSNNKQLLVLLSVLPLLGAYGLQNSKRAGYIPPVAPATWSNAVPMYPIYFGSSPGFGNFAAGSFGSAEGYHAGGSFGHSYNAKPFQTITGLGTGTQIGNGFPMNTNLHSNNFAHSAASNVVYYNKGGVNNVGSNFVQNPVGWSHNGGNINNGYTRLARSISFQPGASYQQTPNEYANTVNPVQQLPTNEYQNTPHASGYNPQTAIVPPKSHMQQLPPSNEYQPSKIPEYGPQTNQWPKRPVATQRIPSIPQTNQAIPTFPGIQTQQNTRWVNNGRGGNQWPTNGGGSNNGGNGRGNGGLIGNRNTNPVIVNSIGSGQRLPPPETATLRTINVQPTAAKVNDPFNRPGIESASRFRNSNPVKRLESPEPQQLSFRRNVALVKNSGTNRLVTGSGNRNLNSQLMIDERRRQMQVNDWYRLLFGRLPQSARVI